MAIFRHEKTKKLLYRHEPPLIAQAKKKGRPKATQWVVIDCHRSHAVTYIGKRIWLGVYIFLCGLKAAVPQRLGYGDRWHRQVISHP